MCLTVCNQHAEELKLDDRSVSPGLVTSHYAEMPEQEVLDEPKSHLRREHREKLGAETLGGCTTADIEAQAHLGMASPRSKCIPRSCHGPEGPGDTRQLNAMG